MPVHFSVPYIGLITSLMSVNCFHSNASIEPEITEEFVRICLSSAKDGRTQLIKMGEKPFPIYIKMLKSDKESINTYVVIFNVIEKADADRSCFRDFALTALSKNSPALRVSVLSLLRKIGKPVDTPPLFALLSKQDYANVYSIINTISEIGDNKSLIGLKIYQSETAFSKDVKFMNYLGDKIASMEIRIREK